jgi:hypothetical protein
MTLRSILLLRNFTRTYGVWARSEGRPVAEKTRLSSEMPPCTPDSSGLAKRAPNPPLATGV